MLRIPASGADATAVTPSGIIMLWASGLSRFFINGKPTFIIGPRCVPRILPNSTVADSLDYFFDNFVLADELFVKTLWSFETCLLVSNNLCGELVSSLEF